MKTRILLACAATTVTLLYGCATQNTESSQMADKATADAEPVAQATNDTVAQETKNVDKPSTPVSTAEPAPPPMKVAEKAPAKMAENPIPEVPEKPCDIKGKKVTLDGKPIGITIEMGYCASNNKPEGSKFWIPDDEVPAIGNIRVDDRCNITYCLSTPHYDHFNISDGTHDLQVQIRWEDSKPIIY
jgi:hypothetical protein